jgi:hypothetical protein
MVIGSKSEKAGLGIRSTRRAIRVFGGSAWTKGLTGKVSKRISDRVIKRLLLQSAGFEEYKPLSITSSTAITKTSS